MVLTLVLLSGAPGLLFMKVKRMLDVMKAKFLKLAIVSILFIFGFCIFWNPYSFFIYLYQIWCSVYTTYFTSVDLNDINDICSPIHAIEQINAINQNLRIYLVPLLESMYFRYAKIDLTKSCPFFKNETICMQNDCTIPSSIKFNKFPSSWKNISLGSITFPSLRKEKKQMSIWDDNSVDFSLFDSENSSSGVYVNLLENPEQYTGYAGHSAHQIWRAIYQENCFNYYKKSSQILMDEKAKIIQAAKEDFESEDDWDDAFSEPKKGCPERALFYKLISGLHTSISMHICYKYLNHTSGTFYPNLECYKERIGHHPQRTENLYFTYMVLLRSLQKLGSYLSRYPFETGNEYENQKAREIVEKTSLITIQCPNMFNERSLFQGEASIALKKEFRYHFRNISRIMDCVGCEKCRLWGKIQTLGMGTALKVLFSYENHPDILKDSQTFDYHLTRMEVVALINTIGKFSDSILYSSIFDQMTHPYQEEKPKFKGLYWKIITKVVVAFLLITILTILKKKKTWIICL